MTDKRDRYRAQVDRAVIDFGSARGWSVQQVNRAARLAYRTIFTESDWHIYASVNVSGSIDILPNDGYPSHGGDLNSVGLYQGRMPWYPVVPSMDPYLSTQLFLAEMLASVPAWYSLDEARACQLTQRSQYDSVTIDPATGYPYVFAANYRAREDQTNALALDRLYFTHHANIASS